jgi:dienelactone hydrolase
MGKVIVSDIFGRTPALEDLAGAVGAVTDIIDPYGGKQMGFPTEPRAYDHFMTHVGIPAYEEILSSRLAEIPRVSVLIGFSVGAAAIWGISQTLTPERIGHAVCFYGSQIRHATDIVPGIRIKHILPGMEPGFNINDLAAALSGKKNITVHKTPYLHGFMNRLSPNFSRAGYADGLNRLR